MDEHNLKIFLVYTHSIAGALPITLIITSDEQKETLLLAFTLWKEVIGPAAFYGKDSPNVFMTDNCSDLRDVLSELFNAILLLCQFHMLQQVWRWLFDRKHGVTEIDRSEIMIKFRQLMYMASAGETCYI